MTNARHALAALAMLLVLASCGAAGMPEAPQPGITITGEATMGIARNGTN